MKFVIDNAGDSDVGIDGFNLKVSLPNPGFDGVEWEEMCKAVLNELYNGETKGDVYTAEEFEEIQESEEDVEKELEDLFLEEEV